MLVSKIGTGEVPAKDANNIRKIIENLDSMQVISSKEVMEVLGCQTTKARQILKTMEQQEFIRGISGKGKGKYILNIMKN